MKTYWCEKHGYCSEYMVQFFLKDVFEKVITPTITSFLVDKIPVFKDPIKPYCSHCTENYIIEIWR